MVNVKPGSTNMSSKTNSKPLEQPIELCEPNIRISITIWSLGHTYKTLNVENETQRNGMEKSSTCTLYTFKIIISNENDIEVHAEIYRKNYEWQAVPSWKLALRWEWNSTQRSNVIARNLIA